ncbi:hypothetical protein FACS189447_04300 [Spirochaetia bacterium]|nr:hypothetical protein FACS189447_04300 [Spirochaetia bacterium]
MGKKVVQRFYKRLSPFVMILGLFSCAGFINGEQSSYVEFNESGKRLRVKGNQLEYGRDGDFKPVVLRGVNVGDLYHFRALGIAPPDYKRIARDLNANAIRIAVHPGRLWMRDRERSLTYLEENVKKAVSAGLFVIIDYHTIADPNGKVQAFEDSNVGYSADFNLAREFWDIISKRYGDGRVLFEIWNEPLGKYRVYEDGKNSWDVMKSYWEELVAIIRHNGRDNVIIAAGHAWTSDLRHIKDSLIEDLNTAYSWHIYGGSDTSRDTDEWEMRLDGLYKIRPVLVTEWGFSVDPSGKQYSSPADFADPLVSLFFKDKNLHNFAWGYDPFYTPTMLINRDYNSLNAYGQYVADYLKSCNQERP